MTHTEFDVFFKLFVDECYKLIQTKGEEYSRGEDRFANFRRMADRNGISMLKAANILLGKHIDSIDTYVTEGKTFSNESIQGRFHDAVNYLILMAGIVVEESGKGKQTQAQDSNSRRLCKDCGLCFWDEFELANHWFRVHRKKDDPAVVTQKEVNGLNPPTFRCNNCDLTFHAMEEYRDHWGQSHISPLEFNPNYVWSCLPCKITFLSEKLYRKHWEYTHGKDLNFKNILTTNPSITCSNCKTAFPGTKEYNEHWASCHGHSPT